MATLYTIGHSTRTIEELIDALKAHKIQTLVDIRAFPASKRLPQFNREALDASLSAAGIRYAWMKGLGGYRKKVWKNLRILVCGMPASAIMPTTCLPLSLKEP